MGAIAALYRQLPQRKKPTQQQQSRVLKETADDSDIRFGHTVSVASGDGPARTLNSPSSPTSSSSKPISLSAGPDLTGSSKSKSKNKKDKNKVKPFNLEKEKPQLLQTLASASVASTNLLNALKLINRENERVSENAEAMKRFETCKTLRRQILRYIQNVESEQWLGGLIHANEELVNALMAFEVLDKSVEDDSDSEEDSPAAKTGRTSSPPTRNFAGLVLDNKPTKPPRPGADVPKPAFSHSNGKERQYSDDESELEEEEEEEDENDPFADRNAVETPFTEREGITWSACSLVFPARTVANNCAESGRKFDFPIVTYHAYYLSLVRAIATTLSRVSQGTLFLYFGAEHALEEQDPTRSSHVPFSKTLETVFPRY
jgi:LAS seventeen-binding protein 5